MGGSRDRGKGFYALLKFFKNFKIFLTFEGRRLETCNERNGHFKGEQANKMLKNFQNFQTF